MKLAILGTRGIPNNYGGFEQFAEFISVGLVEKGHDVTVYNPRVHPYKADEYKGVKIIHISSPENIIGSAANFYYDFYCLKDAAKRNFDVIYEAGYATCSPFYYLLNNTNTRLITNMDGLEWKRSKWGLITKRLMQFLEKLAVRKSHYLVSDNKGIQEYYRSQFNKESFFVAYGADLALGVDKTYLKKFDVKEGDYYILIARMEPENNIDIILDAYKQTSNEATFLVVGNYKTKYGDYLYKKYNNGTIKFLGSIYDKPALDALRFYSKAYLHGHSVGGTNPSLLEAMASGAFIIAHKNIFNESVLKKNALYFESKSELTGIFKDINSLYDFNRDTFIENNIKEITSNYSWHSIVNRYEEIFKQIIEIN